MRLVNIDDCNRALFYKQCGGKDSLITVESAFNMFEALPTAYDIDKVVKELEKELSLADREKERCARENPLQFDSAKGYAHGVGNSIEIVKQEAEQCNNGWIPCSERFPEESGYYLVTYHDWSDGNFLPKYDDTYVRRLHYQISDHFVGWNYPKNVDDRAENDCHKEVIAWQPLPEPFKERD